MAKNKLSLYKLPTSYVAMDLETTGLDPAVDQIVEIAGIKVIEGVVTGTFQSYANPKIPISIEASKVNGITQEQLKEAPSVEAAISGFIEFSDSLPILGHNAKKFDKHFLEKVCDECPSKWYDTMEMAENLLGRRYVSLKDLCKMAGVKNEKAHSALSDAMATHDCFQWLRGEVAKVTTDARDFSNHATTGKLADEIVCITGEHPRLSRHEIMQVVCDNGGALSNSVTKKTTLLVNFGSGATGKAKKAAEYKEQTGIRVVDGEEFCKLVGIEYAVTPKRKGLDECAKQNPAFDNSDPSTDAKGAVKFAARACLCGCLAVVVLAVVALLILRSCVSAIL